MVQAQSESAATGGGSIVPNLTNGDSIKKVTGRNASYLNGLMSMNHVVGGIAKGGALSKILASSSTTSTQSDTAISPSRSEHPVKMIEVAHSLKHNHSEITREPSSSGNSAASGSARSISIMPGAPNMVSGAEPIVKLVSNNSESKNSAAAEKMTESCSGAEKTAAANSVIVKKSPLEILEIKLDYAFNDAQRHAEIFEQQRILRQAERDIAEIESGRKRFTNPMQKDAILETAKAKKAAADQSLRDSGPPRYAQTLKKLHDVTKAIEAFCAALTDSNKCSEAMQSSVLRLEEVMAPIDNIWNGIPGKTPDLCRPGVKTADDACVSTSERLKQIQKHLEAKINTVDGAQLQRISVVKENKAFKEILSLHDAGELPKDGSLIFFTSDGLLLYQSELKVSQRSTQSRAKDAASAQRHAANTPAFIDVVRLSQGLGPEGAGLWRFIGQENRIVGAAILRPVFKDGKPVELPGAKNGRGEPMVKKEVTMIVGEIPPEVTLNMAYGHLLNTLRAKKTALEKGIEPKAKETFAPDAVTGPVRIQADAKADMAECAVSPKPQRISISVFAEGA